MKFENEEPITDPVVAYKLLRRSFGDRTERTLHTRWYDRDAHVPFIQVAVFASGYTKDEFTSAKMFKVSADVVEVLQKEKLLEGEKHWGWTDSTTLSLREGHLLSDDEVGLLFGVQPIKEEA
jgi:hypothetical protein